MLLFPEGKGFYKYEKPGGKIATPDDEVTAIIEEHRRQAGIQRRSISTQVKLKTCTGIAVGD